jgi:hypothetical protein
VQEKRDAATAGDDVTSTCCRREATSATVVAALQKLVLLPSAASLPCTDSGASGQAWQCGPVWPRPEIHTRRRGQGSGRGCVKMSLAWGGLLDQVVREVMLRCVKHRMWALWLTSSCDGDRVQKNIHGGCLYY